jgi:hypothetical protein
MMGMKDSRVFNVSESDQLSMARLKITEAIEAYYLHQKRQTEGI